MSLYRFMALSGIQETMKPSTIAIIILKYIFGQFRSKPLPVSSVLPAYEFLLIFSQKSVATTSLYLSVHHPWDHRIANGRNDCRDAKLEQQHCDAVNTTLIWATESLVEVRPGNSSYCIVMMQHLCSHRVVDQITSVSMLSVPTRPRSEVEGDNVIYGYPW
jgi:hypothetical protein